jgi:hypothetical protein
VGFAIHVQYGRGWAEAYVQHAANVGRLRGGLHEPYPAWLVTVAFITELLPVAGKIALYLLIRDFLPGKSRLMKGLSYGLLLMAIGDTLVRAPLMDALVGNPVDVVLVQNAEGWAIDLSVGSVIALLAP